MKYRQWINKVTKAEQPANNLTLIRLGFFGYAMTGGGGGGRFPPPPPPPPEISAVGHAIATKFCAHFAPDVIYMIA